MLLGGSKYQTCLTFVSQAALDLGIKEQLKLEKQVVAVKNCRNIGKRYALNDATPQIEVNPETYQVLVDGVAISCEAANILPLAQRYFLF